MKLSVVIVAIFQSRRFFLFVRKHANCCCCCCCCCPLMQQKNRRTLRRFFAVVVVKVFCCCFDFNCRNTRLQFCSVGLDLKCFFALLLLLSFDKICNSPFFFVFLFSSSGVADKRRVYFFCFPCIVLCYFSSLIYFYCLLLQDDLRSAKWRDPMELVFLWRV